MALTHYRPPHHPKTRKTEYLTREFPQKVRLIPQTPLLDRLLPKMRRLAAKKLLTDAIEAHTDEPETVFDIGLDEVERCISDADAIYYSAVHHVAPSIQLGHHEALKPLHDERCEDIRGSQYEPNARLVAEQKRMKEYRGLNADEHEAIARRRTGFGLLLLKLGQIADDSQRVLNAKYADLSALVNEDEVFDRHAFARAQERHPRIAELVSEIKTWLDE